MRIQHNIMAMNAYRNYTNNVAAMKQNLEKLSSGYKINRAGDDAAGLAISEKMRAQITGLQTAQKNAKDGISLVQTAEGALTEVHDMLNRMVELATQSANGTYDNDVDRFQLQKEMNQLRSEINRIADSSNFNGIQLLDGSMSTEGATIAAGVLEAGSAATKNVVVATDVLTWATEGKAITNATFTQAPATDCMHLKADSGTGALGSFTVDFGGLNVTSASGTKASVKITIGNASTTYEAATTGGKITAADIAADLAGKFFVIKSDGTQEIVTGSTAIATDTLVYKATKNADNNSVTFTAVAVAAKSANASAVTATDAEATTAAKLTSAADLPDSIVASQQLIDLNFTVSASVVDPDKAKEAEGFQQVGVTKYTNTEAAGKQQFAQAVVQLDPSVITDGMTISVNGKEMVIRLSGNAGEGEIDLTKVAASGSDGNGNVIYSLEAGDKAAVAQAIANAYAQEDLGGIEVGVDGNNNLVIAEKINADRTSAVTNATLAKALSSYASFKGLVEFKTVTENDDAVDGEVTLTLDASRLTKGATLTLTNATGAASTYTIGSNLGDLVSAIGSSIAALSTDGKSITITYTVDPTMTEAQNKAKAKVEGRSLTLQIGDTAADYNQLKVDINDCHTWALGIDTISINDQVSAADAVDAIKAAINKVSDVRGTLGATQNRLDHTINNLSVMTENIQDAESTIRDTDVAEEMMAYTKNNILIQSAQAMLAQANQVPQGVLQLLQ